MTQPADYDAHLREVVYAIIDQMPLTTDGTGHISACGWDDTHGNPTCGCSDLPSRIAHVLRDFIPPKGTDQ